MLSTGVRENGSAFVSKDVQPSKRLRLRGKTRLSSMHIHRATIYAFAHIYTYTHTHIHTCMHAYIHTYTHIHIHTYTHTHVHTYTHAQIHIYIYIYIYIFTFKTTQT